MDYSSVPDDYPLYRLIGRMSGELLWLLPLLFVSAVASFAVVA